MSELNGKLAYRYKKNDRVFFKIFSKNDFIPDGAEELPISEMYSDSLTGLLTQAEVAQKYNVPYSFQQRVFRLGFYK